MNYTELLWLTGIILLVFFYVWGTYNSFVKKKNQVDVDYSDIDIQLKRRSSLIQNLADMVKAYAKHEESTFEEVAKARAAVDGSKSAAESAKAGGMLDQTLRSLFAVVENYPKLQASQNFQSLQSELKNTEDLIAIYREEYNRSVQRYNNNILTFPNLLVNAMFKFPKAQLFQISDSPDNIVKI